MATNCMAKTKLEDYTTTEFPKEITLEDVFASYNGKPGCMCGCNGKYSYKTSEIDYASKNRGYEVAFKECNDKSVKMMFNKMKKMTTKFEIGYDYIYTETETRCYMLQIKR